jgi:glyoxylase-like metal-dependent hydrolase (beta-lactamase superfamily II)
MIKEILPGLYSWSEYSEEKKLDFNGLLIIGKGESVIIDPPDLVKDDEVELKKLIDSHLSCPLKGVLLTNVHHERASSLLKDQFSVPVWVNALDKEALETSTDKTFKGGDILFCGIQTIQLEHQKSPGETAFYIKDQKIMILGDALIGKVPGQVNMLPPDKYQDPAKAKTGLSQLLDYDFETLLVGDGSSILKDAKEVVKTFLSH